MLSVLFRQQIKKLSRDSKICPPKTVGRLSEVDEATLGGKIQNAHCSSYTKSLAASHAYALPIVHEHQIRAERNGQRDSGRFPFIEPFYGCFAKWTGWRFLDIKPCRRMGNPVPHRRRSVRVGQLRFHGGWQDHFLE